MKERVPQDLPLVSAALPPPLHTHFLSLTTPLRLPSSQRFLYVLRNKQQYATVAMLSRYMPEQEPRILQLGGSTKDLYYVSVHVYMCRMISPL
jgi:hypothetical protein